MLGSNVTPAIVAACAALKSAGITGTIVGEIVGIDLDPVAPGEAERCASYGAERRRYGPRRRSISTRCST
jgi:hypothetical protein